METFKLSCEVTVSAYTEVRAETLKKAIKEAESRYIELDMNHGSGSDEEWLISEADGELRNIRCDND